MSERILDIQDLRVSFDTYAGEVQAVRGVSFHVDQGEVLAIVGESGCGKSVTAPFVWESTTLWLPGKRRCRPFGARKSP